MHTDFVFLQVKFLQNHEIYQYGNFEGKLDLKNGYFYRKMSKNRPKLVIFVKNNENRSLGNGESGKKCTRTYGFLFKNGP